MIPNMNVPFLVMAGLTLVVLVLQVLAFRQHPRRRKDSYVTAVVWLFVAGLDIYAGVERSNSYVVVLGFMALGVAVVAYVGTKLAMAHRSFR